MNRHVLVQQLGSLKTLTAMNAGGQIVGRRRKGAGGGALWVLVGEEVGGERYRGGVAAVAQRALVQLAGLVGVAVSPQRFPPASPDRQKQSAQRVIR